MTATTTKVASYITSSFARDLVGTELPGDADLHAMGIVNSLGLVRLVSWVGQEFDIPVAELDFTPDQFHTVDRIVEFIRIHTDRRP
ncbi:phosphopantetheine-binding protein [Nocardia sp. BMG111209]|uniref:phosphopantetheine-binding protein n=1 Tax=Nocardia sp. BMG111209 TaxID=1160137 RepID=UPI0003614B1E|nr:acyl carrier protein [Nocardia sp. BMG111209]